jgi:hypothetical protein
MASIGVRFPRGLEEDKGNIVYYAMRGQSIVGFMSELGARVVFSKTVVGRLDTKTNIAEFAHPLRTKAFFASFTKAILLVST